MKLCQPTTLQEMKLSNISNASTGQNNRISTSEIADKNMKLLYSLCNAVQTIYLSTSLTINYSS